jgi:hypothetical protein
MSREREPRPSTGERRKLWRPENQARKSEAKDGESMAGKTGFSKDGQYFFGPSPSRKKEMRQTKESPVRSNSNKDFDGNPTPRKGPPKVGQSSRLIDFAMAKDAFGNSPDNEPGANGNRASNRQTRRGRPSQNNSKGPKPPRATLTFAGRKTRRAFKNVIGAENSTLKTRSLPGQEKLLEAPNAPPKNVPKTITPPPRPSRSKSPDTRNPSRGLPGRPKSPLPGRTSAVPPTRYSASRSLPPLKPRHTGPKTTENLRPPKTDKVSQPSDWRRRPN